MKRLGPELKMPKFRASSFKAPPFVTDLFHDLRDRRLLPLIALVLVAIVTVPFLLGNDSEEALPTPESLGVIEELKAEAADPASLTVVEAKPGLRDYRKRLRGRTPTDPFVQRYTAPVLKGADLPEPSKGEAGSSSSSSETTTTTVKTDDGDSVTVTETDTGGGDSGGASPGSPPQNGDGDGGSGGGDAAPDDQGIVLYSFAIDVKIVKTSGEGSERETDEPTVKHRVLPTTPLPGKKAPVVTYMGISPKTKKPTFLVSPEVTAMFGEGKCAAGTDVCQLVELEPGFPQTFVYGAAATRYKFKVLAVEPVASGRL